MRRGYLYLTPGREYIYIYGQPVVQNPKMCDKQMGKPEATICCLCVFHLPVIGVQCLLSLACISCCRPSRQLSDQYDVFGFVFFLVGGLPQAAPPVLCCLHRRRRASVEYIYIYIYMRDDVYIHSRPGGVAKTSAFIEYVGLGVAKTSTLSNMLGSAAKTSTFIE